MNWMESCRARLPAYLDKNGDLAPPWERFPSYERYTIGWRMGAGEDWLGLWQAFLETLAPDFEKRLAYLRRHAPAPFTWAESVHHALHPSDSDDDDSDDDDASGAAQRRASLLEQGLIASDIAFKTWLSQQEGVRWPWTCADTPETAARYWTRDLWFWSRQVATLRNDPAWTTPELPERWASCASALHTGKTSTLALREGLLSLAQMLAAGAVIPPWQLGLELRDFADSFDDDMGYVDAFRLWGMSAFDDVQHLRRYLDPTNPPAEWEAWVQEQFAPSV